MERSVREKAIRLRKRHWTYSEIATNLHVSKGILSHWLRDIPYTPRQEVIVRSNLARARNAQVLANRKAARVRSILGTAKREIGSLSKGDLHLLGVMAYWAEGSKTVDSIVKFTNTDPELIRLMVRWLREICGVTREKMRFHLRIHPGENVAVTEAYWAAVTGIPANQFYRTTRKTSGSEGRTVRKVRYGIASVVVCDARLFYRIMGWVDGVKSSLFSNTPRP